VTVRTGLLHFIQRHCPRTRTCFLPGLLAPFECLPCLLEIIAYMQRVCREPRRLDDPKLCKNFLLGFCPAEEFQRTKHDYGTCLLDHDEEAKAQVHNATRFRCNKRGR